jgi:hypothetical protein
MGSRAGGATAGPMGRAGPGHATWREAPASYLTFERSDPELAEADMFVMDSLMSPIALKTIGIVVGVIAFFTYLSIATYLSQRRKERDTYYRFELRKKALEQGAPGETLIELQRQEDLLHQRRRRESLKLGGLVTAGSGIGLLGIVLAKQDLETIGAAFLPLFIGLALYVYAQWMAPRGIDLDRRDDAGRGSGAPRV